MKYFIKTKLFLNENKTPSSESLSDYNSDSTLTVLQLKEIGKSKLKFPPTSVINSESLMVKGEIKPDGDLISPTDGISYTLKIVN